jgi:predicted amidophosphoribosyltransferase
MQGQKMTRKFMEVFDMKKCPDCNSEIKFQGEYCPHCSAALYGRNKHRAEKNFDFKKYSLIAGIM